MKFIFMI